MVIIHLTCCLLTKARTTWLYLWHAQRIISVSLGKTTCLLESRLGSPTWLSLKISMKNVAFRQGRNWKSTKLRVDVKAANMAIFDGMNTSSLWGDNESLEENALQVLLGKL